MNFPPSTLKSMRLFLLLIPYFLFANSEIIKTNKGAVRGFQKDGLSIFLGIPFAKPPVGDLRWRAPQEMDAWKGVKDCQKFSASPMQNTPAPFAYWSEEYLIPKEPISEDCLYLNIWTKKTSKPKPVLVYIYGGGFRSGGTACPIYDGSNMAKEDVVFVSLNYRVGVFGFMSHPELNKESISGTSGNYAILDLIKGLQWIQQNIAKFGGDPKMVTIAGQSAGATAVSILCVSPLAKRLFRGAILQSGALGLGLALPNQELAKQNKERVEKLGVQLAEKLNASSIADLRNKSAEEIQKANFGNTSPYPDGYVIPFNYKDAYLNGKQNDVNLLLGWNKDDRVAGKPLPAEKYIEQIKSRFKENADHILSLYPGKTDEEAYRSQIELGRNESFGSKQYELAKLQEAKGKGAIYVYRFNRNIPAYTADTQFGAFHTGEVPYAFQNLHIVKRPYEEADQVLSKQMSSYWLNFTKTGSPSAPNLPNWPAYNQKDKKIILLDTKVEAVRIPDEKQLEL
jgi:para-nitrobenzyl esterase